MPIYSAGECLQKLLCSEIKNPVKKNNIVSQISTTFSYALLTGNMLHKYLLGNQQPNQKHGYTCWLSNHHIIAQSAQLYLSNPSTALSLHRSDFEKIVQLLLNFHVRVFSYEFFGDGARRHILQRLQNII